MSIQIINYLIISRLLLVTINYNKAKNKSLLEWSISFLLESWVCSIFLTTISYFWGICLSPKAIHSIAWCKLDFSEIKLGSGILNYLLLQLDLLHLSKE